MNEPRIRLPRSATVAPPQNRDNPSSFSSSTMGKRRFPSHTSPQHPPVTFSGRETVSSFHQPRSHPSSPRPPPPQPRKPSLVTNAGPPPPVVPPFFSMDYHLKMPGVIDNPKKLAKFDFIRVLPKGTEYAVYFQQNTLTFYPRTSSTPAVSIPHHPVTRNGADSIPRLLFFCTMVKPSFFLITNLVFYGDTFLSTHAERMAALTGLFQQGWFEVAPTPSRQQPPAAAARVGIESRFEDMTFYPTQVFSQWTEFVKGSLHLPYEIKHLEYCFYKENLTNQTQQFIYILNKKVAKKATHDTDLVFTNPHVDWQSKEKNRFRHDVLPQTTQKGQPEAYPSFKTCVLTQTPYLNLVGWSHLDKQEESENEN